MPTSSDAPLLLQTLRLDPAAHPRGQPHLSAASGLVRVGQRLYVVADDELHLGVFEDIAATGGKPVNGTLLRLLEGELPQDKGKRKKAKPDFESLALLPPLPGCPAGALLALGSGSKPQRHAAVLLALDAHGVPNGRSALVDLEALYVPLHKEFADLNIEGAWVASGELLLLQRGNKGNARNACIRYDWNQVAPWLSGQRAEPPAAKSVQTIALGEVDGVPLGLTDGAALPGGEWVFSAVAEDTDDSVQDGACVASAVGIVGPDGLVRRMQRLHGAPKVEGIVVQAEGDDWVLTLVTDPDDPQVAARVLQLRIKKSR
ncbi:DUF6910 family protein [Rhodoferax saidenbachensis]|uniref:Uncharacterized protein n=1 Tax=Rhodoferax saidenbachensis TaxID=1484693 RepID=A0ABU1ZT09_9BURK|nr:hypothetical protein [Rhodoferax saidenbachensis]MDR7308694.1 hypothetical protein [Rhodoferax saidenbachensis]